MTDFIDRIIGCAESPIEDDMLRALVAVAGDSLILVDPGDVRDMGTWALHDDDRRYVFACPQAVVGRYRCDLLVMAFCTALYPKVICVECDGHAYHKANHNQMQRDSKRDEWFKSKGIRTLRFSGKKIKRDPFACAHRILRVVTGQADNGAGFRQLGAALTGAFPDFKSVNKRSHALSNAANFSFGDAP